MCRCIEDRVRKREYSSTFSERSFSVMLSFKSMISCSVFRRKHVWWIWMFSKTTNDPPILKNGFWHSQHSHDISCPVSFRLCNSSKKKSRLWRRRRRGYEDDEDVRRRRLHKQDDEDVYYETFDADTSATSVETFDADTSATAAETLEVGGFEGTRPGGTPEC